MHVMALGKRVVSRPGVSAPALWRDRRGNAAVEFALVVLPFFALLIAILQVSLTFFAQQVLETASEKAVRELVTGNAQKAGMNRAQFKTLVCLKLPSFMSCNNVLIDVRVTTAFAAADTSRPTVTYDASGNPTNLAFTPGASGEINIAKVMYVWNVPKALMGLDLSTASNGTRLLVATSVFKTEPY